MKLILFLVSIIILTGVGCSQKWRGFYYPNGCLTCEKDYIYSPVFSSLEQCRDWAEETKKSRGNSSSDDYECGLNCKSKDGYNVCSDTVK